MPKNIKRVVAGVSGGADSTAMLLMLKDAEISVDAVHCNFHLRGEESDRDMHFTEALCRRLGIPLTVVHFDTETYQQAHGLSAETACRELRYVKFRELRESTGADRIAVAHNADDQAETVLLNLMRGSGVSGLRAMLEDTGEIWRPLLGKTRREILDFLAERQQEYMTDSTNADSGYRRNFIRNEVLPLLETRWPSARKSLCRTAEIMAAEEEQLAQYSPDWHTRKWAMRQGANATQCEEMIRTLHNANFRSGSHWLVPGGRIVAERDGLHFIATDQENRFEVETEELPCDFPDERMREAGPDYLFTTLPPDMIEFRHHKEGDRLKPLGISGSAKVSKVMKDAKLSWVAKERIVVAVEKGSGEIVWVEGLKRSRLFLADGKSPLFRYWIKHEEENENSGHA